MDFSFGQRVEELQATLLDFMSTHIYPAEAVYRAEMEKSGDPHHHPNVIEDLKAEARSRGLWNLFLPAVSGLSVLEYAPLAEITGRSPHLAPEALNCSAPDTGNMEILHMFGTEEQKARWLAPLLEGEIRSAFSMSEPAVASSDPTNLETTISTDDDDLVIDGTKWFSTGAASARCEITIVMGVIDPDADTYHRQSMVVVPMRSPGLTVEEEPAVFGYQERGGHPRISFDGVRVPVGNLLGQRGSGFAMAQARLGPGRIHHCMRAIGAAERCLDLMVMRSQDRMAFGKPLSDQGVIREWIADARIKIEQARLLVLKTAWLIDRVGTKGARTEIAAIKVVAPNLLADVADRAIQVFGAAGLTPAFPLAELYSMGRWLRIADGPDEVHRRSVARAELARLAPSSVDTW